MEGIGATETIVIAAILAAMVIYAIGMVVTQERDRRRRWRRRDQERQALRAEPIDLFSTGGYIRGGADQVPADIDRIDGLGGNPPGATP